MSYEVIQALKAQYGYHAGYDTRSDEYWAVKRAIDVVVDEHDLERDPELSGGGAMLRHLAQWTVYRNEFGAILQTSFGDHELHFFTHTHFLLQKLVREVRATGVKLVRK